MIAGHTDDILRTNQLDSIGIGALGPDTEGEGLCVDPLNVTNGQNAPQFSYLRYAKPCSHAR